MTGLSCKLEDAGRLTHFPIWNFPQGMFTRNCSHKNSNHAQNLIHMWDKNQHFPCMLSRVKCTAKTGIKNSLIQHPVCNCNRFYRWDIPGSLDRRPNIFRCLKTFGGHTSTHKCLKTLWQNLLHNWCMNWNWQKYTSRISDGNSGIKNLIGMFQRDMWSNICYQLQSKS